MVGLMFLLTAQAFAGEVVFEGQYRKLAASSEACPGGLSVRVDQSASGVLSAFVASEPHRGGLPLELYGEAGTSVRESSAGRVDVITSIAVNASRLELVFHHVTSDQAVYTYTFRAVNRSMTFQMMTGSVPQPLTCAYTLR